MCIDGVLDISKIIMDCKSAIYINTTRKKELKKSRGCLKNVREGIFEEGGRRQ